MNLHFPILDNDKAYLGTWLFLPKQYVAESVLRSALTLPIDQTKSLVCYQDHPNHLAVPRSLIPLDEVREQMPLIDLRPQHMEYPISSDIRLDAVRPDRSTQRESIDALTQADSGLLNLACGLGKTIVALELIARLKQKTLIVVKGDGLIGQWKDQIAAHLSFDTPLGHIQGPVSSWVWEGCAVTIASLDTLSYHRNRVPAALRRAPGLIIFDECHLLGARQLSQTATLFYGKRVGLTATVHREDDMESVFLWHVGPVLYQDLSQDLIPRVTLLPSPVRISLRDPAIWAEVRDRRGELSHTRLMNYAVNQKEELDFVEHHIREALKAGRRVLAISMSKDQLNALHQRFPDSGLITGDVKGQKARQHALSQHQLTFGIASLTREGLDEKALDTLFILTEFKAEGMLQQTVGRGQRQLEGKQKDCHVVIVQHRNVEGVRGRAYKMVSYFRRQGFEVTVAPNR
jgi:superfamily II DNA or RNA helicase